MKKLFCIAIDTDGGLDVTEGSLFQVLMNGMANGHPFNLGIKGLTVERLFNEVTGECDSAAHVDITHPHDAHGCTHSQGGK